jgi:hypothetical protein
MKSLNRETWLRIAINAWIVLAIAASVKTVIDPERHTVYTAFSHACRDWWDGNTLYVDRAYYYSPTFAILMTPFAIWPDSFGGVLWNFASVGVLVYALRVFFRDVLGERARSGGRGARRENRGSDTRLVWPYESPLRPRLPVGVEGFYLLLVLAGSARSVWSGQSNAILVALVLLAAAAIVRRQWWLAALLLATPIYIKIWPIAVAGLFAIQWPKHLAPRLVVFTMVLGLVPLLTKSPMGVAASYTDWCHCLTNRESTQFRFSGYRDAWTIWEQFQSPVDKRAYLILQAAAAVATLAWCVWQSRRNQSPQWQAIATIAVWSAWQLLFGPGTERLTYNLIAPALAWAVLSAFQARRDRTWITATYVTTYLLGLGGVERILNGHVPLATALEPIGVVMFAAWVIAAGMRRGEPVNEQMDCCLKLASQPEMQRAA